MSVATPLERLGHAIHTGSVRCDRGGELRPVAEHRGSPGVEGHDHVDAGTNVTPPFGVGGHLAQDVGEVVGRVLDGEAGSARDTELPRERRARVPGGRRHVSPGP